LEIHIAVLTKVKPLQKTISVSTSFPKSAHNGEIHYLGKYCSMQMTQYQIPFMYITAWFLSLLFSHGWHLVRNACNRKCRRKRKI